MSIYLDNSGIKKAFINHSNKPVWFGYVNDNGTIKKFYDITEAISKIIVYPRALFLDPSTPTMTNANETTMAGLSGYGSLTVGSNYIQTISNRNNSSIWVMLEAELIFKSFDSNLGYGYYPIDYICGTYKKFDASVIKYSLSATGYVYYRGSTSTSSYGYAFNDLMGVEIGNCSASTSSTVTKTFNENNTIPEGLAFGYIGSGRQSGSQNITSKITFNSFSINGVSIPIVCENRIK